MAITPSNPDVGLPDPALSEFKKFIYDNYHETHFGEESESAWKRRVQAHVHVMRLMLPPNKAAPLLDLGCGDGVLLAAAQTIGYTELTGVDLSEGLLQKASLHTKAKLTHADGLEFLKSSPDGAFEAVIAFDIFEHLTRPELLSACREIVRVLKPGGRLIVRAPNGESPIYNQLLWSDITHERPLTQASLTQILKPLGFDHIEAMEWPPLVRGVKSGIHAALWYLFRAVYALQIRLEAGSGRRILSINLHLIARKGMAAHTD